MCIYTHTKQLYFNIILRIFKTIYSSLSFSIFFKITPLLLMRVEVAQAGELTKQFL